MPSHDHKDSTLLGRLSRSVALLTFGLAVLAFLIAIERPHWFNLRPVSGAAAAMAQGGAAPPQS